MHRGKTNSCFLAQIFSKNHERSRMRILVPSTQQRLTLEGILLASRWANDLPSHWALPLPPASFFLVFSAAHSTGRCPNPRSLPPHPTGMKLNSFGMPNHSSPSRMGSLFFFWNSIFCLVRSLEVPKSVDERQIFSWQNSSHHLSSGRCPECTSLKCTLLVPCQWHISGTFPHVFH